MEHVMPHLGFSFPSCNAVITNREIARTKQIHTNKLRNVKGTIDTKLPESFKHGHRRNLKREQLLEGDHVRVRFSPSGGRILERRVPPVGCVPQSNLPRSRPHLPERYTAIERANRILLEKMSHILQEVR